MEHYFEHKVEVIGFASPRIGKVLKSRGHEVSEEFETLPILVLAKHIPST